MIIFLNLLFILFSHTSYATANDDLVILVNGEKQKTITMADVKKLTSKDVEYYDYRLRKSEKYKGVSLLTLLNLILPEQIKKTVEIEFFSSNGYKTYYPIENFYKVDGILAYESTAGKFERYSIKDKSIISLAPYFLVWDFKSDAKEDKHQYGSAYQVNIVNLNSTAIDFGVTSLKGNENVTLGYRTYKRYCLSCHAIGKWGGDIAIDLVKMNIVENKGSDFIMKYVFDTSSHNSHNEMITLPKYKNIDSMALAVVEFLKFTSSPDLYLKNNKINPSNVRYEEFKNILKDIKENKK